MREERPQLFREVFRARRPSEDQVNNVVRSEISSTAEPQTAKVSRVVAMSLFEVERSKLKGWRRARRRHLPIEKSKN